MIGIAQSDGRVLAARVSHGKHNISRRLDTSYGTRLRATMLISLGAIATIGSTPAECRLQGDGAEPELVEPTAFEAMRLKGVTDFHLFDDSGSWVHWSDSREADLELVIALED